MPNKIIIIRHGQTSHNKNKIMQGHLDTLLDDVGQDQAQRVAAMIIKEKIDVFFSSDLKRALHTAQVVAHQKPIQITPLLRERYFGKLQGMTIAKIGEIISGFGLKGNYSFKGREKEFNIETEENIHKRISEFRALLAGYKGKTVALVSHGGFIKRLLKALGAIQEIDSVSIPNATPIVLIKKGDVYVLEQKII